MLIDTHAHLMPATPTTSGPRVRVDRAGDGYLISPESRRAVPRGLWDVGRRLADMDRAGIDVQVVSPVADVAAHAWSADPSYASDVNESLAHACVRSGGRLVGLGCVSAVDVRGDLARCLALGLRGVQVGTTIGGHDLDAPELAGFWHAAESAGASVFVHPIRAGAGVLRRGEAALEVGLGMPTDLAIAASALVFGGVLRRHPALRISLAGGGGSFAWAYDRLRHAYGEQRATDADEVVRRLYVDTAMLGPVHAVMLTDRFGDERILYGTDAPFLPAPPVDARHGSVTSPDRETSSTNALRFLGIDAV